MQASSSSASTTPFMLGSSKASFGHAEPGAGMVGIFHTLVAQQQRVQLPIMHLRVLNPLVGSVLDTATAAGAGEGRVFHMPRQAGAAAPQLDESAAKTGISAFAFQGMCGLYCEMDQS